MSIQNQEIINVDSNNKSNYLQSPTKLKIGNSPINTSSVIIINPRDAENPRRNNFINSKIQRKEEDFNQVKDIKQRDLKVQITWKNVRIFIDEDCCRLFNNNKSKVDQERNLNTNLNQTNINQTNTNINLDHFYSINSLQNSPINPTRLGMTPTLSNNEHTNLNEIRDSNLKDKKIILNNISGTVLPGQFLTIIGASGSGKTTLLSYLSGKNLATNLAHEGEVLFNQIPRSQIDYSSLIAFVQQEDILTELMTVKENIYFACQLRSSESEEEINAKCDTIINTFGLYHVQNQAIGGIMKKIISGGERKRTSIAIELVSGTPLIFLDEPTTGLDSVMATNITKALSKYAQEGNTIIATVHQPNSDMIKHFDQLMILSQGKVVYFNKANFLIDYLKGVGKPKYICPQRMNPAEFVLILISSEAFIELGDNYNENTLANTNNIPLRKYQKRMKKLFNFYEHSKYKSNIYTKAPNLAELTPENIQAITKKPGFITQFSILLTRAMKLQMRAFLPNSVRDLMIIFVGLLTIACYSNLGDIGPSAYNDRLGLFSIISMVDFLVSMNTAITIFPDERALFMREQVSGLYDVLPYYLSKIISEYPFMIFDPLLIRLILHWSCHLRNEASLFFISFGSGIIVTFYGYAFALAIGILIERREAVFFAFSVVYVPLFLCSGAFTDLSDLFPLIWIIQWFSPFRYANQILMREELSGRMFEYNSLATGSARFVTGETLLDIYGIDLSISTCFIALTALYVGYVILGFILLKIFVWRIKI